MGTGPQGSAVIFSLGLGKSSQFLSMHTCAGCLKSNSLNANASRAKHMGTHFGKVQVNLTSVESNFTPWLTSSSTWSTKAQVRPYTSVCTPSGSLLMHSQEKRTPGPVTIGSMQSILMRYQLVLQQQMSIGEQNCLTNMHTHSSHRNRILISCGPS